MNKQYDDLNDQWREITQILRRAIVEKNEEIEKLEQQIENLEKFIKSPDVRVDNDYSSCSDACTDLY